MTVTPSPTSSLGIRIYYEDTDAAGVVYHASYLRFYERARTEWLRQLGLEQRRLHTQGVAFVVSEMALSFKQPAFLDQEVVVHTAVEAIHGTRLVFKQSIYLVSPTSSEPSKNTAAATVATPDSTDLPCLNQARVVVATISSQTLRPCRLPGFILRVLSP